MGLVWDDGHGLNLDEHIGMDEAADLNRRIDRADATEEFVVRARKVFELTEIREIGASLDDVIQFGASLLEKELDLFEDMDALTVHVAG